MSAVELQQAHKRSLCLATEFVNMLNEMRFGKLDYATARAFQQLSREVKYDDGIEPTEL